MSGSCHTAREALVLGDEGVGAGQAHVSPQPAGLRRGVEVGPESLELQRAVSRFQGTSAAFIFACKMEGHR